MKSKSQMKRIKIQKKTAKLNTYRVGVAFFNYIDIKAVNEEQARDLVKHMSIKGLLQSDDVIFKIEYCDELFTNDDCDRDYNNIGEE